jgi:hypothetical protein
MTSNGLSIRRSRVEGTSPCANRPRQIKRTVTRATYRPDNGHSSPRPTLCCARHSGRSMMASDRQPGPLRWRASVTTGGVVSMSCDYFQPACRRNASVFSLKAGTLRRKRVRPEDVARISDAASSAVSESRRANGVIRKIWGARIWLSRRRVVLDYCVGLLDERPGAAVWGARGRSRTRLVCGRACATTRREAPWRIPLITVSGMSSICLAINCHPFTTV